MKVSSYRSIIRVVYSFVPISLVAIYSTQVENVSLCQGVCRITTIHNLLSKENAETGPIQHARIKVSRKLKCPVPVSVAKGR